MSDRGLRGSNLGARSLESDEGITAAPRQNIEYVCQDGTIIVVPFAADAEVPSVWEDRRGLPAVRRDAEIPEDKPMKPARTHWDMLLERRTIAELDDLLKERLELLRAGVIGAGRKSTV